MVIYPIADMFRGYVLYFAKVLRRHGLINIQDSPSHALPLPEVLDTFDTQKTGLSSDVAVARLRMVGENRLPQSSAKSRWLRLALQFHNPLIYVLMVAGIATFMLHDYVDAGVIAAVIIINALIGFVQEGKAEEALKAVRSLMATRAKVLRDGQHADIDASLLVSGDVVILEPGDLVPADLRLMQVKNCFVMEAALTGESVPVEKNIDIVAVEAPVAERLCMAYSSTLVTAGYAHGVVVATGKQTEIGKIGTMVSDEQSLETPLTRRLGLFAKQVTLLILIIGVFSFAFGYWVRQMPLLDLFVAVVGLVVAAIPEGLPAIVAIVLAIGTRVMAKNKAIVRRLAAVETLGSVTVICSDKTGTLTCNQMTAVTVILPEQTLNVSGVGYAPKGDFFKNGEWLDVTLAHDLESLLMCATLCNDGGVQQNEEGAWELRGDPTEGALQTLAAKAGVDKLNLQQRYPRLDCIPFESEHQYMATLHLSQTGEGVVLLKGAPETVLAHCQRDLSGPLDLERWEARMAEAAKRGERVLALARRILPTNSTTLSMAAMDDNFELLGMVGMLDPPRAEAMAAVAECQAAGLRVVMITGDHAITASAIAKQIGLNASAILSGEQIEKMDDAELREQMKTVDVISRASPQHKLRLVKALQSLGELVAMTGDGVNDAPAIKVADIGVAMGNKGTAAAREAADLVLTDDNFATISNAVKEGRVVLDNIKKSMLFILPTDVAEAGVILLAILGGLSLPITASQILWINTVTAVTFSLAIAFERPERGVMQRPPRLPTEPLITKLFATRIIVVSALLMAFTFTAFEWELSRGHSLAMSRTTAVNMLIMCQMAYLFNVKYFTHSSMRISAFIENRITLVVCGVMIVLQALFTYSPWMQSVFSTEPIDVASWLFILAFAILMFLVIELEKAVLRTFKVQVI